MFDLAERRQKAEEIARKVIRDLVVAEGCHLRRGLIAGKTGLDRDAIRWTQAEELCRDYAACLAYAVEEMKLVGLGEAGRAIGEEAIAAVIRRREEVAVEALRGGYYRLNDIAAVLHGVPSHPHPGVN